MLNVTIHSNISIILPFYKNCISISCLTLLLPCFSVQIKHKSCKNMEHPIRKPCTIQIRVFLADERRGISRVNDFSLFPTLPPSHLAITMLKYSSSPPPRASPSQAIPKKYKQASKLVFSDSHQS